VSRLCSRRDVSRLHERDTAGREAILETHMRRYEASAWNAHVYGTQSSRGSLGESVFSHLYDTKALRAAHREGTRGLDASGVRGSRGPRARGKERTLGRHLRDILSRQQRRYAQLVASEGVLSIAQARNGRSLRELHIPSLCRRGVSPLPSSDLGRAVLSLHVSSAESVEAVGRRGYRESPRQEAARPLVLCRVSCEDDFAIFLRPNRRVRL